MFQTNAIVSPHQNMNVMGGMSGVFQIVSFVFRKIGPTNRIHPAVWSSLLINFWFLCLPCPLSSMLLLGSQRRPDLHQLGLWTARSGSTRERRSWDAATSPPRAITAVRVSYRRAAAVVVVLFQEAGRYKVFAEPVFGCGLVAAEKLPLWSARQACVQPGLEGDR